MRAESCVALKSLSLAEFRHLRLGKGSMGNEKDAYNFKAAYRYLNGFLVLPESLDMVIVKGSYDKVYKFERF